MIVKSNVNSRHSVIDFFQVYFLYLNTDLAFRDRNLRGMLTLYHETFSQYIKPEFNYIPDQVDWCQSFKTKIL